jgi:hypothetical protein
VGLARNFEPEDTMGYLIVPLIFTIMAAPDPTLTPERLADFARLRKAIGQTVYVTDSNGQERRLTLLEAGEREVTFGTGAHSIVMQKDAVFTVDRSRDTTLDGTVKGAAIGLIMGLLTASAYEESEGEIVLSGVLTYGAVGYLLDRANTARQPLYRARPVASAAQTLQPPRPLVRFRW